MCVLFSALPIRDLVSINPIFLGAMGEDKRVLGCGECAFFSERNSLVD